VIDIYEYAERINRESMPGKKYCAHWTSNGVRAFNLLPGTYTAKVLETNLKGNEKEFSDIQIQGGKTRSIESSF